MVASLGCGHEDEQMAVILATVIASPVFLWRSCRRGGSFSRRMGVTVLALSLFAITHLASSPMAAEPGEFFVKSVVEKKLKELPPGPLYWRIENFPTLDEAQTAADASPTSFAAEVSGKFWLFTLGPSARCRASRRMNICCGSIMQAVRPAQKRRCIRIPAPRHSMSLPVRSAKERRTA
jgi:hypothetical protein